MGVDYRADAGIGFKIKIPTFQKENDDFYFDEYLDNLLNFDKFRYFQDGAGALTGDENDYFIVIKDLFPLENLLEKINELKEFLLKEDLIEVNQNVDLQIGLEVW